MNHEAPLMEDGNLSASLQEDYVIFSSLVDVSQEVYFSVGESIVKEGEHADSFYIIIEGCVRVTRGSADATELIAILYVGAIIGMNPRLFFGNELRSFKRTADVVCAKTVKALKISFEDIGVENNANYD